ncbi:pilus assembly protein PilP [Roseivivax marinus]|jgi:Tfp pilus assembly protein PilP|uniref:pilus assembly protein PilP n=1 Tax=Roseivivax marinus TaxID=1379903 RepID=UPI0008CDD9DE|nr:pilus assembly protein PilP [Roseivivax marinus]UMA66033.1 pilus assembly protein PilP [Roseivivax marinus]SEL02529.1 Pilus assembly protein, PilP [Roseivivax marinus]
MAETNDAATPENVAKTATTHADFDRHDTMVLGVYGDENAPEALLRTPDGKVARVRKGERLGRHTIVAIDETRVALLTRGGRARWIEMPGG